MKIIGRVDGSTAGYFYEFPLSRGQAALWFHYQLAPEAVAYNLAGAVTVSEYTDLEALRHAFQKLAERHPMLRTRFSSTHGVGVQREFASSEIAFQYEDASRWETDQLDQRLAEEIYRPFDLEQGPIWRVVVFRRAPISKENDSSEYSRHHLILLVLHHIIGDLWSSAILLSEAAALYGEEKTGVPAQLKLLRTSYADHIKNEAERLAGPQAEMSWDYWRTYLSGELIPLNLPTDRPRLPIATGRGAVQTLHLDPNLTQALRSLAEKEHVALYPVLLTAFQALLHRYTGQTDILVGFPKAGRSPASIRVVGYFVNQTIVRSDFSENPPFTVLLNSVQTSISESARHAWYPFPEIVQRLQPARDLSRSPLIQAVFSWQQAPRLIPRENAGALVLGLADQVVHLGGLRLHSVPLPFHVAAFDISMLAAEIPDGLAVTIEYATDLFDAASIARMALCYQTLLESITAEPEQKISDLTILPETERAQLLEDWNATQVDYPDRACLHQRFEQQVERTPQANAVLSGEEELSYDQLNQQANQLAHFLQAQGVSQDTIIGVCLEPSAQMVVALLGILKAGGAYLPLDPSYPQERLAYILTDAHPALLLTRQGLRQHLPDFGGSLVCLGTDSDRLLSQCNTNPINPTNPDQLAYIMYTSGSTGQPKGAAINHRGVISLLTDFQRRQPIQPGDACSWWTSPSFDVSIYEIFAPLLAGGSLQVIPEKLRLDAPHLLDWLYIHCIRSAYLPPFLLADFAAWIESHPGASQLRRLLVGVEPIPHALLAGICAQLPNLCIINGYGPTETTICSTLYVIEPAYPYPGNAPIGKPAANTQIYLLDHALNPVPIGAVGEIYIGGVGLARGYYNHPERTAEHFVPSPFRSGEQLYQTGDLARYLPDGNLIYVGRVDTQVKVHGVRIELGEIEAALALHPQVKQAAVLQQELPSGGKSLVAYVVPTQTPSPAPETLRQFLIERLPHAMVPTVFVILDSFPLTPTGKLDRKAFSLPHNLPSKQKYPHRAPQTATEQLLVAIWHQVLRVEPIGVDDNFFELGGDSILSLQIVAKAREAGIPIRPQSVFQAPTIAGLAALAATVAPIRKQPEPENTVGPISLTPIQRWFIEQNFPEPHHWNQSLMFTTSRPLEPIHLRSAVSALILHHDALRLRFTNGPSGWQQTISDQDDEIPCEIINLSDMGKFQQMDAIERQIAVQQRSLNLTIGPLIRVIYFHFGPERSGRLLIVVHHLVVDGVSWRILLEDLQTAYRQYERGLPVQLPPKTTPFHTWAQRLAKFARSSDLDQEADFWLQTCETQLPAIPTDEIPLEASNDNRNTEDTAEQVSVSLPSEETQALLTGISDAYGTEVPDILLTALARVLQRWIGNESFLVDLEAHGRADLFEDMDLSQTVGWFTVFYPVHLSISKDADPGQAIMMVKEQLRNVPHHGLGFGLLRYLSPDSTLRDRLKAAQTASVIFNYLGQVLESSNEGHFSFDAPEMVGYQRSPNAQRPYQIEVNAVILQGKLHVVWIYSSRLHTRQTMEQLANHFITELHTLIDHCLSPQSIGYTPSDFQGAGLKKAEIRRILQLTSGSMGSTTKRNLEAIYPLSPMQQGMVFHTLYAPQSGVYFEQTIFTIQGALDLPMFAKAWQRVLYRHAILRTAFVWEGLDRMLQVVYKDVKVQIEQLDWRSFPLPEQQDRFECLLTKDRSRGFDLSTPPLWRLVICRTAEDTYQVLFNHHHAILDGWSLPLLFVEVFAFYDAVRKDQYLSLPPPKAYQEYIAWLQSRDLSAAETFWRNELAGFVPAFWPRVQPTLAPPAGAARPAGMEACLSVQTTNDLQAFARQQHITISTLVQGAWAILLNHHLQRDDLLFGITVAGRPTEIPDCTAMVGLFINSLPFRVRIASSSRLSEWLQQIQQKAIEIQQFDFSPLAQIQAWSGILPRSALFDTLLVVENYPIDKNLHQQVDELQIGNIRTIEQAAYPLTVAVLPGQELHLKILYDPDRFERKVIDCILTDLCQVLEKMICDPDQSISALLSLISPSQEPCLENQTGKTTPSQVQKNNPSFFKQQKNEVTVKTGGTAGHLPSGNPLQEHLMHLWIKLLKIDVVGIQDNFFELGGDSLVGAICIYQLQDALQETIPLNAIFESPTVFALSKYLQQNHPAGVARLLGTSISGSVISETAIIPKILVPIQPNGSRPPLFCIHPAGGIVFPYYILSHYLGKDQPMYGIQDPRLYTPQSPLKSIEALATEYLAALKTVQPEGPYHLLGWSMGGVLAYEMAQQLSQQGQSVALLIMLDASAPLSAYPWQSQSSGRGRLRQIRLWLQRLPNHVSDIRSAIEPIATYVRSGLYLLTASIKHGNSQTERKPTISHLFGWVGLDTWRTRLLREAEVTNTVSQDASLLLYEMPAVRLILELVLEHRKIARHYTPLPYHGRVTLFRAVRSGRKENSFEDLTLGWGALAKNGVEIHTIQANHVALMVKPYVEIVAQELRACLDPKDGSSLP